jgi:hypothetical protein
VIFLIGSADSGSKAFGAAGTATAAADVELEAAAEVIDRSTETDEPAESNEPENRAPANSVVRAENGAAGMEVDAEAAEDIGIDG